MWNCLITEIVDSSREVKSEVESVEVIDPESPVARNYKKQTPLKMILWCWRLIHPDAKPCWIK